MKFAHALVRLSRNLEALAARFAVVGGLAASARGEVRFTADIDVAVVVENDAEAERYVFALKQSGYVVLATVEQESEMFAFIESCHNQVRLHARSHYETPNEVEADLRDGALAA